MLYFVSLYIISKHLFCKKKKEKKNTRAFKKLGINSKLL